MNTDKNEKMIVKISPRRHRDTEESLSWSRTMPFSVISVSSVAIGVA
jgi:hypothetical protein